MGEPFFSVIIPVYKVEAYLEKCVQSVLDQTFQDFEIILVDDGSPDNCPKICDNLAANDCRIKVLHKQNGGLSSARNEGTKIATGIYVTYLDSDDYWCDNNLLQQLFDRSTAFREDMILFGCKIVNVDGTEEVSRSNYNIDILNMHCKKDTLAYLYKSGKMPGSAWILIVKKSLLDRLSLSFRYGVTAEDYEWLISLLSECNAIGAIDGVHYAYIRREGSITTTAKLSGIKGIMHAIDKYKSLDNPDLKTLADYVCRIYLIALMSYCKLPTTEKQEGARLLQKYKHILKVSSNKSYYWVITILGYSMSSRLVRRVYNSIR